MTSTPRCVTPLLALVAVTTFASADAQAADPTTADCLAASDASLRSGNEHRLRLERSQLLTCAASSCPADIRKECARRVDVINAQIPTIIFSAKDSAGADLSAVKVTMDGEVLTERLEGTALSIDPGEHTFTFEANGQPTVTRRLVVQQSQKESREQITLGSAGATQLVGSGRVRHDTRGADERHARNAKSAGHLGWRARRRRPRPRGSVRYRRNVRQKRREARLPRDGLSNAGRSRTVALGLHSSNGLYCGLRGGGRGPGGRDRAVGHGAKSGSPGWVDSAGAGAARRLVSDFASGLLFAPR
jgi:hypothetical protein